MKPEPQVGPQYGCHPTTTHPAAPSTTSANWPYPGPLSHSLEEDGDRLISAPSKPGATSRSSNGTAAAPGRQHGAGSQRYDSYGAGNEPGAQGRETQGGGTRGETRSSTHEAYALLAQRLASRVSGATGMATMIVILSINGQDDPMVWLGGRQERLRIWRIMGYVASCGRKQDRQWGGH